jgi:hypothetical protein
MQLSSNVPHLVKKSYWGGSNERSAFLRMRKYSFDLDSVELTPEVLQQSDCVLIATNHDNFDYEMIKANAKLIVDTRWVTGNLPIISCGHKGMISPQRHRGRI